MTRDSDFKQVVRARMAETSESYTAARAALERESYDAARAEQERLVGRLFTDGRIERVPARRKVRAAVLLEVGQHDLQVRRHDLQHIDPTIDHRVHEPLDVQDHVLLDQERCCANQ